MQTINRYNKLAALAGFVLIHSLISCKKDLLNTSPETSISDAAAFSTPAKILAQVNNLYSQTQNATFYGGRFLVFNEQRGDEFSQNDANAATGALVWGQNVFPSTEFVNNLWTAAYRAINSANILIDNLASGTVVSDSLKKNYTAEAKFLRGLIYFSLVQTYAKPYALDNASLGLPLWLTPQTSEGNSDLERSSVSAVYTQIITDLDAAESDLPVGYSSAALNSSRAHKATAIALKTRVYLVKGQYGKVVTEASKIVPSSAPFQYTSGTTTHKLETSLATVFGGSYTGAEAILFLPFANSTTETPGSQSSLAYTYLGQPILSLNTAAIISDPVFASATDARAGLITTSGTGQKLLKKFAIITAPFRDYVPVIRYAEILLNYAEAAAQNDDLTKATALLYAVRNRADAGFIFPSADIDTKDALIATILKERRIELLGEGFRTPDLQRRVQTLPAKNGQAGVAPAVAPSASNYIWPIPATEISTNKKIVQNP